MARSRRTTVSIGAGLALAAAMLVPGPPAVAAEPVVTNGCVDSVPEPGSSTPVKICYTLFQPAGASPQAKVPMMLHSHGWGGTRTRTAASFQGWLAAGFGVLSFDQRAHGESGGVAHVMNPDLEGRDVVKIVDVVAGLDWVRTNKPRDPVLGAMGGSYGGGYQFAGGGSKLPPAVQQAFVTAITTGGWPAGQAGKDLTAFFAKNGPAWHVKHGRKLDIPVLIGQGLTDNLFNLNQGLKNFDKALTGKARARSMLVGYNGGHTLPSVLPPGFGTPGDPCSVALGSPSFADLSLRFMRLNLKREQTGLRGFGQYHLSTADGRCVTQRSLTPNTRYRLPSILTTTGAGLPFAVKVARGPVKLAGPGRLDARVTGLLPNSRAFFALSVGATPLDALIVQNNTMPLREATKVWGVRRSVELPAVAVDVPAGKNLYLTVTPVADMYAGQSSLPPGILKLDQVSLSVHRTR